MEKSLKNPDCADAMQLLETLFALPKQDYTQYSPLTLAYIGDGVYDLVIRSILVKRANMQAMKLHQKASLVVKAPAQAQAATSLIGEMTEEELAVFHRGCNAKPGNTAKNATRKEYLEATGYEALIGYLYLQKRYARMLHLIRKGLENTGKKL